MLEVIVRPDFLPRRGHSAWHDHEESGRSHSQVSVVADLTLV